MKKALLILFSLVLLLSSGMLSTDSTAAGTDMDYGEYSVDSPPDYDAFLTEQAASMNEALAEGVLIPIDEEHFPDENFREYVRRFDLFNGGSFDVFELSMIRSIDCSGRDIASLRGIEYFTALASLDCSNNRITELDVSGFPELNILSCMGNRLTELDVSNNPALSGLYCSGNLLTDLDVSSNPRLRYLVCENNRLAKLDVSKNPMLSELCCSSNELTELDVSQNTMLWILYCSDNQLAELDIGHNPDLNMLVCSGNELTSLDVSQNPFLETLECDRNRLQTLDVSACYLTDYLIKIGKQAYDDGARLFYVEKQPAPEWMWEDYFPVDPNLDVPFNRVKTFEDVELLRWLVCDASVTVIAGDLTILGALAPTIPSIELRG